MSSHTKTQSTRGNQPKITADQPMEPRGDFSPHVRAIICPKGEERTNSPNRQNVMKKEQVNLKKKKKAKRTSGNGKPL